MNQAIKKYLPKHGRVLDSFAGEGTTLVECVATGNDGVGFEINPYAFLASKVKALAFEINEKELKNCISDFMTYYRAQTRSKAQPSSTSPEKFATKFNFTVLRFFTRF